MTSRRVRTVRTAVLDHVSAAAMDEASFHGVEDPGTVVWLRRVYGANVARFRARLAESEALGGNRLAGWPVAAFDEDPGWRLRGEMSALAGEDRWRRADGRRVNGWPDDDPRHLLRDG